MLVVDQQYLWSMVVGQQIGYGRELGRVDSRCKGSSFEAKVNDRNYLEDRIFGINRGFRYGE